MTDFIFQGKNIHYESQLLCLNSSLNFSYLDILQRKKSLSMHPPMHKPTTTCPCVDCSSPVPVSTPCCLIFIKSISAASVAVVLRRSRPLAKSILIDHHWLSHTRIDPVQTHAQGPLKTHSPHNSLTNEVLPPSGVSSKRLFLIFLPLCNYCSH